MDTYDGFWPILLGCMMVHDRQWAWHEVREVIFDVNILFSNYYMVINQKNRQCFWRVCKMAVLLQR